MTSTHKLMTSSLTPEQHWTLKARCRGRWELFDEVEDIEGNPHYPYLDEARKLCRKCPVRSTCRTKSETGNRDGWEPTGIWDGKPHP